MVKKFHYRDKVCIVSGASTGIGAAFAKELAAQGAHMVLFSRRANRLNGVAATFPEFTDFLVISGDVTQAEDRNRLIEQTLERWGRIDVLVNAAGRMGSCAFDALKPDEIDMLVELNLLGLMHLTHLATAQMKIQGAGMIINVSSPAGELALPNLAVYSAAKAGVSVFCQTLHRELKGLGIHVISVEPGYTESEMIYTPSQLAKLQKLRPQTAEHVVRKSLLAASNGKRRILLDPKIGILIWINRLLPRLMDWIAPQIS